MPAVPSRRAATTAARAAVVVAALLVTCLPAVAADPTASPTPTRPPGSAGSVDGGAAGGKAADGKAAGKDAGADGAARTDADERREKADRARADAAADIAQAQKEQAEEAAHDAAALVAASAALTKARADLAVARTALETAQEALAIAREADRSAQLELEASVLAEQRATRDLAVVETRIGVHQQDLGRLARSAYQGNGPMGEWAIVLSSATPDQLADRLAFLQSVGSAGNAMIARLKEDRAELVNAQATLAAARRRQELARAASAAALAAVEGRTLVAEAAAKQVEAVVDARKAAFKQAQQAALEDKRQYQVMVTQSGALATRIVELAGDLADGPKRPKGTGQMVRPGTGAVTSPYGPRFHPILRYVKIHTGVDLAVGDGIAYAADDGVVLLTEYNVAYGNMTVIDHGRAGGLRLSTLYAHQSAIGVQPGDRVVKGQAIGVIGSTGYSTGPHLHFEVRVDGEPLDPAPFLEKAQLPTSTAAALQAARAAAGRSD